MCSIVIQVAHIYILSRNLFHCRLLQAVEYSSQGCTVGPCWFSACVFLTHLSFFFAIMKKLWTKLTASTMLTGFIPFLLLTVLISLFSLILFHCPFPNLRVDASFTYRASLLFNVLGFACSCENALAFIPCWSVDLQWPTCLLTSCYDTCSPALCCTQ